MPETQKTDAQSPGLQRHPVRAGTFGSQTDAQPVPAEETPVARAVDDATKARIEHAKANKGEQSASGADGNALKAHFGKTSSSDDKTACEDCA